MRLSVLRVSEKVSGMSVVGASEALPLRGVSAICDTLVKDGVGKFFPTFPVEGVFPTFCFASIGGL